MKRKNKKKRQIRKKKNTEKHIRKGNFFKKNKERNISEKREKGRKKRKEMEKEKFSVKLKSLSSSIPEHLNRPNYIIIVINSKITILIDNIFDQQPLSSLLSFFHLSTSSLIPTSARRYSSQINSTSPISTWSIQFYRSNSQIPAISHIHAIRPL